MKAVLFYTAALAVSCIFGAVNAQGEPTQTARDALSRALPSTGKCNSGALQKLAQCVCYRASRKRDMPSQLKTACGQFKMPTAKMAAMCSGYSRGERGFNSQLNEFVEGCGGTFSMAMRLGLSKGSGLKEEVSRAGAPEEIDRQVRRGVIWGCWWPWLWPYGWGWWWWWFIVRFYWCWYWLWQRRWCCCFW